MFVKRFVISNRNFNKSKKRDDDDSFKFRSSSKYRSSSKRQQYNYMSYSSRVTYSRVTYSFSFYVSRQFMQNLNYNEQQRQSTLITQLTQLLFSFKKLIIIVFTTKIIVDFDNRNFYRN